ncbi:MAG: hypothetical protein NDI69_01985 [Bacteriovoracaceae bacterium]|nr:hypothetical protein [Bacteriovoracaceae bacterium]
MKLATISFLFIFSVIAKADVQSLSYRDAIVLKKTYLSKNILSLDLLKLHRDFNFDDVRMIAARKSSWSDNLRQRLQGSSGKYRF